MKFRVSPEGRRRLRQIGAAVTHTYRLGRITPKATKVFQAFQSGQLDTDEAYDELETFLDDFIDKHLPLEG